MDTVVHVYNLILVVLNWIAQNVPWDAVIASGVLSGLLVGPYKKIKKWFDHHEAVIITLIGVLGPTLVAVWTYLLHHYGTDPHIVVIQGLAVSFMTQPFYIMFWKPYVLGRLIPTVRLWAAKQLAEAEKLNDDGEPVPAPEDPKPVVPIQDFKP